MKINVAGIKMAEFMGSLKIGGFHGSAEKAFTGCPVRRKSGGFSPGSSGSTFFHMAQVTGIYTPAISIVTHF